MVQCAGPVMAKMERGYLFLKEGHSTSTPLLDAATATNYMLGAKVIYTQILLSPCWCLPSAKLGQGRLQDVVLKSEAVDTPKAGAVGKGPERILRGKCRWPHKLFFQIHYSEAQHIIQEQWWVGPQPVHSSWF